MTKRMLPLVAIAILFFTVAPAAKADHCYKCKIVPAPQVSYCILHTSGPILGWTECYSDEDGCHPSGDRCTAHPAAMASLAADYSVVSVERLDEPQPANAALIATLETPATTR